ncbi:cytochrome c biogenesis protein CcsA [Maribellus sp. CM-23]|uniref:cytochrome c biogenesis protein CcsA n=1 Tax=Maribellus sp. CM-23 TaxID=2781026 RepID=UPI001F324F13|nr:cytochrome c biogenesis protein CcsA [Maribellus sp. CM-23]MCE4563366.1 cytochrome c biogenesis protein CcsA [Maribellus sp. CM-23]
MKKFYAFITSMPFAAFIFLALAFSMAIATFVESSYGTPSARALVYNTRWFEVLWGLFALNLINNLVRYRLFSTRRYTLGIFHLSFLIMILGGAITRYFSFEGMMHIRENQAANYILSSDDYFYAAYEDQHKESKVRFSEVVPKQFSAKFDVDGRNVKVKSVGFIENAVRKAVPSDSGQPAIDFVFAAPGGQGMQSYTFTRGVVLNYPGFTAGFESGDHRMVNFFMKDGALFMRSEVALEETTMASQETVTLPPGDTIAVKSMFLYGFDDFRFLVRNFHPSASFTAVKNQSETNENAVLIEISDGVKQQTVPVYGHSGMAPDTISVPLGSGKLKLAYGARPLYLPFSIYLKDFQLERYPGSESPSSFASEAVLIDGERNINRDIRIFMNNTLTHRGYKFFQSSYDTDEKGTILSVNYDFVGTWVSYFSYFLLIVGMMLSLINKNSYFRFLAKKLKNISVSAVLILGIVGGFSMSASAQGGAEASLPPIDKSVVEEFGQLWVQGVDGRIEPISTLTSEIVRKVSKSSTLYGKSSDEVVLSMMAYPEIWRTLPIIRVSEKDLAVELGVQGKYLAADMLFDSNGNYRIIDEVRAAYAKAPAMRNRLEKEYIYLDERVNICFMVFQGAIFHIYPRERREDTWYAPGSNATEYTDGDSIFIKSGFQLLIQSINDNNNEDAVQLLKAVESFQTKYGAALLPSPTKRNLEILYNKVNPFKRIFPFYLLFGTLLLFVLFVNIFRQKPLPKFFKYGFFALIVILFLVHTAGLALRWYISGHAPWSNGFESVVYVAWATMLAGLIFGRKYPMVIGTAAFLSGIALFVAHLSWMNPEVTPLVPVLKSYWLAIHVAIITASYGFFGLSMILGVLTMIFMVLRSQKNAGKVSGFIEQLTTINEMSVTVGLYFLTIGTFLGGVWANESWGRYWGWDPKETWALITVVIYSFIAHMRMIPSLKGAYNYNFASILGFASVLMTYFGVNYYLSGLHSYGKGVADGVNPAVPISFAVLGGLMLWAYIKESKYEKKLAE